MKVPLVRKKLISDSCVSMNSELATLALHWGHWGARRTEETTQLGYSIDYRTGGSSRAELNCRIAHHTYPLDASRTNPLSVQTTNNSVMDQLITGHQWTAPL